MSARVAHGARGRRRSVVPALYRIDLPDKRGCMETCSPFLYESPADELIAAGFTVLGFRCGLFALCIKLARIGERSFDACVGLEDFDFRKLAATLDQWIEYLRADLLLRPHAFDHLEGLGTTRIAAGDEAVQIGNAPCLIVGRTIELHGLDHAISPAVCGAPNSLGDPVRRTNPQQTIGAGTARYCVLVALVPVLDDVEGGGVVVVDDVAGVIGDVSVVLVGVAACGAGAGENGAVGATDGSEVMAT